MELSKEVNRKLVESFIWSYFDPGDAVYLPISPATVEAIAFLIYAAPIEMRDMIISFSQIWNQDLIAKRRKNEQ